MTNKELIEKCKKYQKLNDEIAKKELEKKQIQAELKRNLSERKLMKWKLIFTVLVIR